MAVHAVGDAGHVADHNLMDVELAGKATPDSVAAQISVALDGLLVGLPGGDGVPTAQATAAGALLAAVAAPEWSQS